MTDAVLRNKITQAVSLDREIAEKTEILKALKGELIVEARSREEDHIATDGGGTSWAAQGSDGCAVNVAFPAPSLKATISNGATLDKVKAAAGTLFDLFFSPVLTYRPCANFRESVAEKMYKADARKLIKLCETATSPRVSFETKEGA